MKMSAQKAFVRLLFLGTAFNTLFGHPVFADLSPVRDYSGGVTQLGLLGQYFYTTANYNSSGGTYTALPFNDNLANYTGTMQLRTNMASRQWSFFGDVQFSGTTAKGYALTNTSTNFSYAKVGTDFVLFENFITVIPEFFAQVPLTTNDFTNLTTAAVGEGVVVASARLNGLFKWSWLTAGGFTGIDYRGNGRSTLLPYGGFAELGMGSLKLGGKLTGYTSIVNDQDTNNTATRTAWQYGADGGSQYFGAVNPQVLQADGYLDYLPNKEMTLSVGGGSTLNGASIAAGWNVVGSFAYRFGGAQRRNHESEPVPDFKEHTQDGVDQKLFVPTETIKNPDPKPLPPPKPRAVPSASDADPQHPEGRKKEAEMKKSMDDAEMKLELKNKSTGGNATESP
jgi:hypothetical protein